MVEYYKNADRARSRRTYPPESETIRRWIRSGRLAARKVGTQHLIEEEDLAALETSTLPLPEGWRRTATEESMPNVVAAFRSSRVSR